MRFVGAESSLDGARVALLGVPLERTVSFRGGPTQAPTAIRAASASLESYSHLFRTDLSQLRVADLGDVDCEATLDEVLERVRSSVGEILEAGTAPGLLGGEHTITLPAVQAAAEKGPVQVVALDAHSDLRDTYRGERISHATVLRRCSEIAHSLHIVGARSLYGGEADEPYFASPKELLRRLTPDIPIWLTLDLDALDPGQCPGVTNPEPGGLSYLDVIKLLQQLQGRNVLGMDIVELAPPFDPSGVSAICAAKLAIEAMCALWGASDL
ncbi:MAG: agmatinase [Candidatus Bipolaricaulota bacterium]